MTRPSGTPKADFAVITVREDEYRAVLQRIGPTKPVRGDHRTYAYARLPSGDLTLNVAVVRTIGQGPVHAADLTRDLISDLDPSCIALVGIGGGFPDTDYTLGDVIVATRLHDFTIGAYLEGTAPEFTNQGAPMHKLIQDLIAFLPAGDRQLSGWNDPSNVGYARPHVSLNPDRFYGSTEWIKRTAEVLAHHFGTGSTMRSPLWVSRAVGSSSFLVKDTAIAGIWRQTARDVAAVEMELGGVIEAAKRVEKEYPVIAIRGISDIVGFKRDPAWTVYACQVAASFFVALLKTLPDTLFRRKLMPEENLPAPPLAEVGSDEPRFSIDEEQLF